MDMLVVQGLLALVSLVILVTASDYFIVFITSFIRKLGIYTHLLGMIIVSLLASLPELAAGISAGAVGLAKMGAAILLGTNIAHLFFVMGVLALYGHGKKVSCPVLRNTNISLFLLSCVPFLLMLDQRFSRQDGVFMILFYVVYLGILYGQQGRLWKPHPLSIPWQDGLRCIAFGAIIILSAYWLIHSISEVSKYQALLSLTVIPLVNSIIDLIAGIRSLSSNKTLVVTDILGSTMTNFLLGLGLLAFLFPFQITLLEFAFVLTFSLMGMVMFLFNVRQGTLDWRYGLTLLLSYFSYIILQGALL